MTLSNLSSYTEQPNTKESDRQPSIPHIVKAFLNGTQVKTRIMASDPQDAITKAQLLPERHWTPC
jgi:hypothetical protein